MRFKIWSRSCWIENNPSTSVGYLAILTKFFFWFSWRFFLAWPSLLPNCTNNWSALNFLVMLSSRFLINFWQSSRCFSIGVKGFSSFFSLLKKPKFDDFYLLAKSWGKILEFILFWFWCYSSIYSRKKDTVADFAWISVSCVWSAEVIEESISYKRGSERPPVISKAVLIFEMLSATFWALSISKSWLWERISRRATPVFASLRSYYSAPLAIWVIFTLVTTEVQQSNA